MPVSTEPGAKQRVMEDDRLWEQVRGTGGAPGRRRSDFLVRPSGTESLIRVMVGGQNSRNRS